MGQNFLYLELLDPEINALLLAISNIVMGLNETKSAHLTIRGPYKSNISPTTVAKCREMMKYDVLQISQVGQFSNPGEEVVYFSVDSPNLRKIWYKPTFTIGDYGYNPHLSVYRGTDKVWATVIASFLAKENISLLCAEFQIVSHITKQAPLLPQTYALSERLTNLTGSGRIESNFLVRLESLAKSYRKSSKSHEFFQDRLI